MATPNDIYNEITRIDNAKQGIAEAIEEKGVQVPEESRIGEYPGLVRQIQTGSPDAVLYTPQDLTSEQQEQARENIGAGTYTKPGTGIPKSDLAAGVQTSLGKADTALQPAALTPITELIPEQATPQNQLADKNFVNSSVATNTANYISDNGQPFQSVADLEAYTGTLTNNDYAFVVGTDSAGNTTYTRYKYNANTQTWAAEYVLNNSSFTAEQWAAISSGITALLVQKLSDLPTEVVTYVAQTLTEAQKQQARTNIGATAPEIFWATYGTTTAAVIEQANTGGKLVACFYQNRIHTLQRITNATLYLTAVCDSIIYYMTVDRRTDAWASFGNTVEFGGRKVQTLVGNETSESKYPSTKAVADALGKMGVVSQTQTWTGSNAAGWDYTMSNLVRGLIPQANIDLYEAAGAVFNATTGYFELNGLTDISYEEMRNIYALTAPSRDELNKSYIFSYNKKIRTNFPTTNVDRFAGQYVNTIGRLKLFYSALASNIEIFAILPFGNTTHKADTDEMRLLLYNANYAKSVQGIINVTYLSNIGAAFSFAYSLESIYLYGLKISVVFGASSRFTLASVVYMVTNATNTTAITITLHATAYARCQADTTEYTYNEQTYTGIIAYAAAKNITIQSA